MSKTYRGGAGAFLRGYRLFPTFQRGYRWLYNDSGEGVYKLFQSEGRGRGGRYLPKKTPLERVKIVHFPQVGQSDFCSFLGVSQGCVPKLGRIEG